MTTPYPRTYGFQGVMNGSTVMRVLLQIRSGTRPILMIHPGNLARPNLDMVTMMKRPSSFMVMMPETRPHPTTLERPSPCRKVPNPFLPSSCSSGTMPLPFISMAQNFIATTTSPRLRGTMTTPPVTSKMKTPMYRPILTRRFYSPATTYWRQKFIRGTPPVPT